MPKLLLKFNAAVIKEFTLDKDVFTVGRKPDNDVVIDNPAVSGHHCKIIKQGDTYFVEDLNSTNGTYINEKRVMKAGLHNNDAVGLASKHALVFMEDRAAEAPAPAAAAKPAGGDATMVLTAEQRDKQAQAAASNNAAAAGKPDKMGNIRVLKGVVGAVEYELKGLSTYIGKSDRVQIPIKGGGLFGSAPEVAASIHRKPEGYYLVAVREGYPVVNNSAVSGQVLLKDGDIIECGATTMQFFLKEIAQS